MNWRLARLCAAGLLLSSLAAGCADSEKKGGGHEGGDADVGPAADGAAGCQPACLPGTYCVDGIRCVEGCEADADCPTGSLCHPHDEICVKTGCFLNSHCPAATPRCYPDQGRCGCGRDADCPPAEECSDSGWCVPDGLECGADQHCGDPTWECSALGFCVPLGKECRSNYQCLTGSYCTEHGFCLPVGQECVEDLQCLPDEHCNAQGWCVTPGRECDTVDQCPAGYTCNVAGFCLLGDRECDLDQHCPAGSRCDDPSGSCVPPLETCRAAGCPPGETCNRFGLCAPDGVECLTAEDCPRGERCREDTSSCAPPGFACNDDEDCGDANQVCNDFGVCVARFGQLALCQACTGDGDCGSPTGVCRNANYTNRQGVAQVEEVCLPQCQRDLDCERGMRCLALRRLDRDVGVCRPRRTSCAGWLSWENPCNLPADCGPDASCADLVIDLTYVSQCTWPCTNLEDCPSGATCLALGHCGH